MRTPAAALVLALVLAACSGPGGGSPSPSASAAPPDSPEAAARAVLALSPLFGSIGPRDPNLIGQAAWWEAAPQGNGWQVTVTAGWGDCPAGCIDRHTWTWSVGADGAVALTAEEGTALTGEVLAGLLTPDGRTGLAAWALAGPTCPVVQPGQPGCLDRAVVGAPLAIRAADGSTVATLATGPGGFVRVALPPGEYVLHADPAAGVMGMPADQPFTVADGQETWVPLAYDTGIR